MRASLVVILLVWGAPHGLAAQPILTLDAQRAHACPDWPRLEMRRGGAEASSDGGYGRSFGGALLGATIGGGLGWLVSPVAEEELFPDCRQSTRNCEGEVHLAPIGVWLGGAVGALAGAQADMDGAAPLLAGVAGGLGSLIGLAALATASNGRGAWGGVGFVGGAAAGAAFGATIAAPGARGRNGMIHRSGRDWDLRVPAVAARPTGSGRPPTVHVVLLSARW